MRVKKNYNPKDKKSSGADAMFNGHFHTHAAKCKPAEAH